MTRLIVIILAIFAIATCLTASEAGIAPIWMAPTNLNYPEQVNATFDADVFENFTANLGEWATIEVATGARGYRSSSVMDSKGTIWILGGTLDRQNPPTSFLTAVWQYNPKTDQYRYVWKSNDPSPFVARDQGELRVPSLSNHPGGIAFGTAAIGKDDNIWLYSYVYWGELWMFNTTSWMFVRQFGSASETTQPKVGSNPGQPGDDVWPGYTEGHCMVIDSKNDVWILSGFNINGYTNSVWHFNTTSFLWTFVAGSVKQINDAHNATFYGGAWMNGCDIDDSDRVWIYGGFGLAGPSSYAHYSDLWTFDTRTKRDWEFESGADTLVEDPQVVSQDYHPDNRPPAAEGPALIDRRDGTLMLVPGAIYFVNGTWGGSDTVWQYSKSLKQWRLVYRDFSTEALNTTGNYSYFRAPGSGLPGHVYVAYAAGKHDGDLYLIGGSLADDRGDQANRKDIWLIPQDQCSNNLYTCDTNADCIEEMVGYSCKCKDGFIGDGFTCVIPSVPTVNTPSAKVSGGSLVGTFMHALAIALAVINV